MTGRPLKHPEQRRNRVKPKSEWTVLPKEGREGPIPSCEGLGLSKAAKEWWETVWRSPQATQWSESDIPALAELAVLRDRLLDGKISVAGEVRLRSDEFGLTPKGRQDRRWIITEEDAIRAGQADEVAEKRNRRRLQAVDPASLTAK